MRAAVLAVAIALSAAGCGGGSTSVPFQSDVRADLNALRHPGAPAEYYLGRRFARLPLTAVFHDKRGDSFMYGTCEASDDSGCAPPIEIQNVTCPGEPTAVAIFVRPDVEGDLVAALVPVNAQARRAGPPRTAIGSNPFGACFSPSG